MNAHWSSDLDAAQQTADRVLRELAASGTPPTDSTIARLNDLAGTCAGLAFSNGAASRLSDTIFNLIRWTDHLDDDEYRERFIVALGSYPLVSPW